MTLPTPEALERVLVDAVDREPDSELIERPDWVQVRTPSSPRAEHNVVLRARLRPEEVSAGIAKVAADHARRGARYRWVVGPSSAPADLAKALEASGLRKMGHTRGMVREVSTPAPLEIEGLRIDPVVPETAEEFGAVTARAWERGPTYQETVTHLARKSFQGPGVSTLSWIARLDGTAVATSHLRLLEGLGYLQGCAVMPTHRRRGIYRALIEHRVGELAARGIPLAVVWADAASSAIACSRAGFIDVCTADFYESPDFA